ncbi:hypothetical protein C8J57DRAFT_1267136 [Mycena rebaudengoi]|nr:hypothetical protein C8J57DRAFT_1267136 [Mycena rebaudengoi]
MLEAVCAWSTAARYLLAGPISREEIPIYISIVDLPRQPIQEHSQLDLLEHWGQLAGWSKPLRNAVTKKLRPMDLRTDRGAVHCEAGLVASLLLRRHTVDVHSPEPPVLTEAFAHLTAKLPDAERAIGMAKKCCPMCRLLIETLQASPTFLRLEYGGGHSRFHPWVPPHWLPSSVLEDLEKRLLHRVSDMVSIGAHLEGSRHTSATAAVASFLKSMGGS